MVQNKKKLSFWFVISGAVLSGYAGYLLNGAWKPGQDFTGFFETLDQVCAAPFANYYNQTTGKAVFMALAVYVTALFLSVTSQRNFMPGKEYGTAKFQSPQAVNKILEDKDKNFNRILSQNVKMSLNFRKLKLNGNILICGGSGAGKTFYEVKPNLMQMPHHCSFICTDPKGEILRSCGQMLKDNGYNVKVINLLEMGQSDCYNPFSYIREETDVVKLITNLISNTTPKGATPSDPFWEKAEGLFLQAIFYYVWLEMPPAMRNFETVLQLLGEAEVTDQEKPSQLDLRMGQLEKTSSLGSAHPAVKQYNKCMRGAGDTVRSIIISANSRLAFLENKQVLRLLSRDDLNLAELGIGVNGDGKTKTALFCVIPDSDKSYNFIIGMLYTQIFQELYYQADFHCGGRLPVHVTFMLDEFSNVALLCFAYLFVRRGFGTEKKKLRYLGFGLAVIFSLAGLFLLRANAQKYKQYFAQATTGFHAMTALKIACAILIVLANKVYKNAAFSISKAREYVPMNKEIVLSYQLGLLLAGLGMFFAFMNRIGFYFLMYEMPFWGQSVRAVTNKGVYRLLIAAILIYIVASAFLSDANGLITYSTYLAMR